MGRDFYEEYPQVRPFFDSTAAGFDLRATCFDAPAETLGDTRYTQACMAAFAASLVALLTEAGHAPQMTAGLSLGEYSALHAAGVFDAETLLDLLAFRGRVMAEAAESTAARMTAILGLQDEDVRAAVAEAQEMQEAGEGLVACANFNCPGQVVIGGEERAVIRAEELCIARGAKRCTPLQTSGPFHTPLMKPAALPLKEKLAATPFAPQRVPVIFNVTAQPAPDEQIKSLLEQQVYSPVLFAQSVRTLEAAGIDTVIEIGPGKALSGFIRRITPQITTHTIQTTEDFRRFTAS
jgi:[acyl-carrier-protein] S-malonyltransferase